jgi:hypothetical protein
VGRIFNIRVAWIVLILAWLEPPGSFKGAALAQPGPLASWNAGAAKQAIIAFVAAVTKQGSPEFVPPGERIATFDNDGTLWCEQPIYVQFAFVLDRLKELAPRHSTGRTAATSNLKIGKFLVCTVSVFGICDERFADEPLFHRYPFRYPVRLRVAARTFFAGGQ